MAKLSREGQMVFDTLLLMHEQGNQDLEKQDGGMRCAFRAGLDGKAGGQQFARHTREYAAWLAGREARRRRVDQGGSCDRHKRKVRAIRMCDDRWELLKYLGRSWLERKLDEEKSMMLGERSNSQEKRT
jgi:hypothetical protein